ncbi:MAG TPA: biotin/lipoyl-binding protein [Pirellulales bacterium]|nr:biotin/lipoyl-binding protein [Pirellulales bacterium]
MFTKYILPLAAATGIAFAWIHVMRAQQVAPPSKPLAAPPRNPYTHTVAGSGVVEPQTENIGIGAPMPGIVVEVYVAVGQKVRAGDKLFLLDQRQLQAELTYRKAVAEAARADLQRLENEPRPEQVPVTEATVREAEANLVDQEDQFNRARELFAKKVISTTEVVAREAAFRTAESRLAKASAELAMLKAGAWEYDKAVARAAVEQAESQVKQTEIELSRLLVQALVDGEVLQVNVRPGEFVGGQWKQSLVVLGNVMQLHARVDIDEHDIPRFTPDAPAKAMLKGWPQEVYDMKFVRVEPYVIPKRSLTNDSGERVDTRVLQVIYSINAQGRRLYVGQQLDVFIDAKPQQTARK